jgi:hypothetical protein
VLSVHAFDFDLVNKVPKAASGDDQNCLPAIKSGKPIPSEEWTMQIRMFWQLWPALLILG